MSDLWTSLLLRLRELVSRLKVRSAERRLHERTVELAVERIIDQVNPRLRGLGGYRRRLFPVVERLLAYAGELAALPHHAVAVDPQSWSADPLVNALFGNVERIRQVVSGPATRAWQKAHPVPEGEDLYALLAAMPVERRQLGMEMDGDRLTRDVQQTTLTFTDHELFAVAESLPESQRLLAQQIVDLIVSLVLADLVAQEERIAALSQAVQMLRLKLKVVVPRAGSADLIRSSSENLAEQERLRARLADAERDLADASRGLADIDQYLTRVVGLLEHPERHLSTERQRWWLDRMNIVRASGDPDAGEIRLLRVRRPDQRGRAVLYIRFPRRLVLTPDQRLAEVERHLGI